MNTKEIQIKQAKGAAHLLITLDKGRVVVQHGDGTVLKEFLATDSSWDLIWNGIQESHEQSSQSLQHTVINALKEDQNENK